MKFKHITILAIALTGITQATAQNPVRNLQADVKQNRYVTLSWEAPTLEESSEVELVPGSFDLWKKITSKPKTSIAQIAQLGDDLYGDLDFSRVKTEGGFWYKLDDDLNKLDSIRVHGPNSRGMASSFPRMIDGKIYATRQARAYRDTVFTYDLTTPDNCEPAFRLKYGSGTRGMAYVPDLDGGAGGWAEASSKEVSFLDQGRKLIEDISLKLSDINSPETGTLDIYGIAYYDHKYYVLGTKGTTAGRMKVPYIWEFDDQGNYLRLVKDMTEYVSALYFLPEDLYIASDKDTGNVYLVTQIKEVDDATKAYICSLFYFELATANSFDGYEVRRNDEVISEENYRQLSFTDDVRAPGEYTYSVKVKYSSLDSEAEEVKLTIYPYGECDAPSALKATVINRSNVQLTWADPAMEDKRVANYHIYRDGEPLATSVSPMYLDKEVAPGTYSYTVTAEYENSGLSEASEAADITLSGVMEMHEPYNLSAVSYINDEGKTAVSLNWTDPMFGTDVTVTPATMKAAGKVGTTDKSMAINYGTSLNEYENYAIDKVSFIAGCAGKYRIAIFDNGSLARDYKFEDGTVIFNGLNTVELTNPLTIKKGHSYMVAVITTPNEDAANMGLSTLTCDNAYVSAGVNYSSFMCSYDTEKITASHFFGCDNVEGNFNIAVGLTPIVNAGLTEEGTPFRGFAVYRNGEKLADMPVQGNEFTDVEIADGDYTYAIASTWDGSDDLLSAPVKRNVTALYGAPDALTATAVDGGANLSWNAPLNGAPTVKRYDSGTSAGKVGLNDGSAFWVSALYDTEDLRSFSDLSITSIEFFPAEYADFRVFVSQDGEEIFSKEIAKVDITPGQAKITNLPAPLAIDATKNLRIGYKVSGYSHAARPASYDDATTANPKGNQISYDGKEWNSASEEGIDANWNLGFTLQYFNRNEVAEAPAMNRHKAVWEEPAAISTGVPETASCAPAKATSLNSNQFQGYKVYRDGTALNTSAFQELTYSDMCGINGDAEYTVAAVYSETPEVHSNKVKVAITGIDMTEADSGLRIEGSIATAPSCIEVYSMGGVKVAESPEGYVDLDTLDKGIYVLRSGKNVVKATVK